MRAGGHLHGKERRRCGTRVRRKEGRPMETGGLAGELLHIFSDSIRKRMERVLQRPDLTEIRLRVYLPAYDPDA